MPTLILVKHSLSAIIPTVPANQWHLSEEGRLRSQLLAQKLSIYHLDVIVSSIEPKAIETAQIIATYLDKPFEVVEGLHEHDRSKVGFLEKKRFEESIAHFFSQPEALILGNETADQAHHRFSRAVAGITARYSNDNVALITHGTVLTLFVSRITDLEPFSLWKQLDLPSWIVLSHPNFELVEVFKSIDGEETRAVV